MGHSLNVDGFYSVPKNLPVAISLDIMLRGDSVIISKNSTLLFNFIDRFMDLWNTPYTILNGKQCPILLFASMDFELFIFQFVVRNSDSE